MATGANSRIADHSLEEAIAEILSQGPRPMVSSTEIAVRLGLDGNRVREILERMSDEGTIVFYRSACIAGADICCLARQASR